MNRIIEEIAESYYKRCNLFLAAEAGRFTSTEAEIYVTNLAYGILRGMRTLDKVIEATKNDDDKTYHKFLLQKKKEEVGHHEWAREDLTYITGRGSEKFNFNHVTKQSKSYHDLVELKADQDPYSFLCYMYFMESITVIAAPKLINDFKEKCHLPLECFSVITKHQEADVGHTQENERILATLLPKEKLSSFNQGLIEYGESFKNALDSFVKGVNIERNFHASI